MDISSGMVDFPLFNLEALDCCKSSKVRIRPTKIDVNPQKQLEESGLSKKAIIAKRKIKLQTQAPAVYGFLVSGSSKITGFSTVKTTSSGLDME
tara:strand:+ start:266 stop:547 length:282 start_codon:yes stop_codon:yes gene_type:complete